VSADRYPILEALGRLEYLGYASAGIATLEHGLLARRRAEGKPENLESSLRVNGSSVEQASVTRARQPVVIHIHPRPRAILLP
jgi:glucosamine 6-phosphate synthetase-like amidotransferase/phosphosugar isomerase protein